jgi:uncharacterized protein (TIGR02186 family)
MMRWAICATLIALAAAPALGREELAAGLSQDTVAITSTYNGTDLVVFGAIERPRENGEYDIVTVVRGPDARMTVRRKDRIAGIWINDARARLSGMPAYYFLAASRPLDAIAPPAMRQSLGLGLANLVPAKAASDGDLAPYRRALIRNQTRRKMYGENPYGVEMIGPTLFRVHVPLPAGAPRGAYVVQVFLFRGGDLLSAHSAPLFVDQAGLERKVFAFAHRRPWLYGLFTVMLAVLIGWLSSLVFGKGF